MFLGGDDRVHGVTPGRSFSANNKICTRRDAARSRAAWREPTRVIESKLFSSWPGLARSLQRLASIEGGPAGRTFRVATFSALMITVSGQKAAYGASRALTLRVAPSISRNPACRFYRLKFITPWPTLLPGPPPPQPSKPNRAIPLGLASCVSSMRLAAGTPTLRPI